MDLVQKTLNAGEQVSNDVNRQWFLLKPGESTRIDKTMFFRALHDFETITLVTDRA